MINIVKHEEIARLRHQLSDHLWQRRKKASEIKEMEDALGLLQKKSREIEDGLQETFTNISRRVEKIPNRCKFRVTYFENAKSKFLNPQSSYALEHTREAQRLAKNRLLRLEDELKALDREIRDIENQIWQLSQQVD